MQYLLPRGYLSYSQMEVWRTSQERYIQEYFECGKKFDSKYLRFGKNMAQLIETGKITEIFPNFKMFDSPEHKILTKIRGVPVLMFLDSYDTATSAFLEYKTGKHAWTKARVQSHDQLTLYASGIYREYGKYPPYCNLIWIPTRDKQRPIGLSNSDDDTVELTGEPPVIFTRTFDFREIVRIEDRVVQTAQEISEAYSKWIQERYPEMQII